MAASAAETQLMDALVKGDDEEGLQTMPKLSLTAGLFADACRDDGAAAAVAGGSGPPPRRGKKISIVGCGGVGTACAFAIINQGLCSELALVDVRKEVVEGEIMDLSHGLAYTNRVEVHGGTDYAATAGSDLVIITAGVRQKEGEDRLSLVGRNFRVFNAIVPPVVEHSPDCCICVISNPCDILTWLAARISGLPPGRVFGSGTSLDSSRFRTLVAERLGVAPRSVHGLICGEHGDSSVAVWSQLNVGGVRLCEMNPKIGQDDDPEQWGLLHRAVIDSAGEVIKRKGYTSWAIGVTAASLAQAVLRNEHRVLPVTVCARGMYGIDQDVFLSLPAVLGSRGAQGRVQLRLAEPEQARLRASAAAIHEVQAPLEAQLASKE